MNITKEEIQKFLKNSVEWLEDQQEGCTTLKLDDRLAVCVGWLPGYGDEVRDDVIQGKDAPDWGINAGIKVWTSDDMRTDYEFINSPYYDNGDVVETDISIDPSDKEDDFEGVAKWLYDSYANLYELDIEEDGRINEESKEEEHDDVDESYQRMDEDLKVICDFSDYEPWSGARDTYEKIERAGMLDAFESLLEDAYPDGLTMTEINDILWFDDEWVLDTLGIKDEEEEEEDDYDEDEEEKDECLHESLKGLSLENPTFRDWKAYYLEDVCGGDVDEYNELYANMYEDDDFGDTICQAFFDVVDDKDNYLGKLGVYKFDMQTWVYEVGFEPNEQYLNKDKLELEDLDLPVDGWFDEKYTHEDIRSEEEYRELAKQFLPKIENALEYSRDEFEDEEETDESLKESKGNPNYNDVKVGDKVLYSKKKYNKRNEPKKDYFKGIVKEINGDTLKLEDDVVVYKEPKDEFDFRFEKIEEIKDSIKDVDIFKQGIDDLDDYQLLQKFRDAKNKYLTLKARQGGNAYPTKDMKRRVDKLKKKLLKRGITKESLESLEEKEDFELETYADWKRAPAGTSVNDGYGWTLKLTNDSYLSSFTNDGYFGDDFIAKNFILDIDDYEDDDEIDGDVDLGDGTIDKSEIWDIIFQNYEYPEELEEDEEFEEDYGISVKRALELIDELYAIHEKGPNDWKE